MNYSKNLRKKAMAQRIIISWVIVALLGTIIGCVIGSALTTHIRAKDKPKEETQTSEQVHDKTLVYGAYDDRIFTEEISLDWGSGDDPDFSTLDCAMPDEQQEFVYYLCKGYNIDFTLVMAMIEVESSYDPAVISKTGDYGYMQINKNNHDWITETIGVTDYLDPYQNIRAGCFILRKLFEQYQDTDFVLMCYNLGENGATKLWERGIYSTAYSEKILSVQEKFNEQIERR